MTDYLVDNSVWAHYVLGHAEAVDRVRAIEREPADLFVTCPPQVLEFCHAARSPEEYTRFRRTISMGFPLERHPHEEDVLDVQQRLWNHGMVRAAGALDILMACYAMLNDATVLTVDRDFGHIARVTDLKQERINLT